MYVDTTIDFTYEICIAGETITEIEGRADVEIDTDYASIMFVDNESIEFFAGTERDHLGKTVVDFNGTPKYRYVRPVKDEPEGVALQNKIAEWICGDGEKRIISRIDMFELIADHLLANAESRRDARDER